MRHLELIGIMVTLAVVATVGAFLCRAMREGYGVWTYYALSLLTTTTWVLTIKRSPYNLLVSSVLWNVIYNGTWTLVTIFVLKEHTSIWQAWGGGVVVLGLVLMGM